jgi:hypothetical protein
MTDYQKAAASGAHSVPACGTGFDLSVGRTADEQEFTLLLRTHLGSSIMRRRIRPPGLTVLVTPTL